MTMTTVVFEALEFRSNTATDSGTVLSAERSARAAVSCSGSGYSAEDWASDSQG